jgi:hypothetical protein
MADVYDMPPQGFRRAAKGWLVSNPAPGSKKLSKLEKENALLKETLQALAERLDKLEQA